MASPTNSPKTSPTVPRKSSPNFFMESPKMARKPASDSSPIPISSQISEKSSTKSQNMNIVKGKGFTLKKK